MHDCIRVIVCWMLLAGRSGLKEYIRVNHMILPFFKPDEKDKGIGKEGQGNKII